MFWFMIFQLSGSRVFTRTIKVYKFTFLKPKNLHKTALLDTFLTAKEQKQQIMKTSRRS